MPEPFTLNLNEIFWSFQGEGSRVGYPSIFLRLTGCLSWCDYCDTKSAWTDGKHMHISEIIAEMNQYKKKYPGSQVIITGGEPLEQNLVPLLKEINKHFSFVAIETNGLYYQDLNVNWWTVSPKDVNEYFINRDLIDKINEVKLIVNDNLKIKTIVSIRQLGPQFPIFLQPQFYDPQKYEHTFALFQRCQKHGLKNIRIGAQLHKIYQVK